MDVPAIVWSDAFGMRDLDAHVGERLPTLRVEGSRKTGAEGAETRKTSLQVAKNCDDLKMDPALRAKRDEYEARMARVKEFEALRKCAICGKKAAGPCKGCRTVAYCSTECQRIDWRDRGHRAACKKIQAERAAEAARAEAPPSPPREIFYGPAPRSGADEVRARIAAEHEAARARREANPEPAPPSARFGSRCPVCFGDWDFAQSAMSMRVCCCRMICTSCENKIGAGKPCPLCRAPCPVGAAAVLALLRRHVDNDQAEAITHLGHQYLRGDLGLVKSAKKAVKLYKRAAELGDIIAMNLLGILYCQGNDGVKLDRKQGMQFYRMAAERGYASSQFNFGKILFSEVELGPRMDIHPKLSGARRWIKLAADQDHVGALFELGLHSLNGRGAAPDVDEAKRYLARAAAKGHEGAAALLNHMNTAPPLRFPIDTAVFCAFGPGDWRAGKVVGLWYREESHPPGVYFPYQVRLDDGSGCYICTTDDDPLIRAAT